MEAVPDSWGPEPFRYPLAQAITGPAYTPAFRVLAVAIVLSCAAATGYLVWSNQLAGNGLLWSAAALSMMGWMTWHIVRSQTTLSAQALHQTWVWDKQLDLADLALVRLIRIPGLEWLIAPRVYARTLGGKFTVFYAASSELMTELSALQRALQTHYGR